MPIPSCPRKPTTIINWTRNEFCFYRAWAFLFFSPNIQSYRNLILFLWGNRLTNPLCYGLPPHNLLPYGTTQPTTSVSLVPQHSQQFKVKKEDP
ncbi:hypothetical protein AVEN_145629-1 [Araneus ventricosus]|uniref:Uncharacterized protein n=1 Tax=Araneus ventricosus TaxID=182803 RepID=A0A4Y2JPU2_ARAVE|nr:hypothetical protein AVEN_145629-1 [Araneus ventricosus]